MSRLEILQDRSIVQVHQRGVVAAAGAVVPLETPPQLHGGTAVHLGAHLDCELLAQRQHHTGGEGQLLNFTKLSQVDLF